MLHVLEPIQYIWKALTAERSPRQIAWGVALGVWLGLIPKGNLTAWLVGVILLATRVNLGSGMLVAMVVTTLSPMTDPLTHAFGLRLLRLETFQMWLAQWHELPLVAWLRLHNTVVLGSATLGLVLLYPVQHLTQRIVTWLAPRFSKVFSRGGADDDREETLEIPVSVQETLRQVASSSGPTKAKAI